MTDVADRISHSSNNQILVLGARVRVSLAIVRSAPTIDGYSSSQRSFAYIAELEVIRGRGIADAD